jgi:hypothetical protein
VYKLVFGPKAFVVVSDPVVVRHILKVGGAQGTDWVALGQPALFHSRGLFNPMP